MRPRPLVLLLVGLVGALVACLPGAAAAVSIEAVEVPERTAAEKAFSVTVRLSNEGPARSIHLFGALYRHVEGKAPCGPATDPSFRTFTHVVQETVHLPADAEVVHPPEGGRWLHRYDVDDAPAAPTLEEFCVFVSEAADGPVIRYEDHASQRLSVRARNAPPQPSFSYDPPRPESTQGVRFLAEASDADGDPVTFAWDFGRYDASGRAKGEGAEVSHAFYPEGEYVVTLTASDGIHAVRLARTIVVAPLGSVEQDGPRDGLGTPAPWWLVGAAVGLAAALRRR